MDKLQVDTMRGLLEGVQISEKVLAKEDHTRIILQYQGGAVPIPVQFVILSTDPEFTEIDALAKTCAARRLSDHQSEIETVSADIMSQATLLKGKRKQ